MKTATIGIRIDELEKERLEAIAQSKDIPVSQIVREAIREYIKQEDLKHE